MSNLDQRCKINAFQALIILCLSFGISFLIPGVILRLPKFPNPYPYLFINLCPEDPNKAPSGLNVLQYRSGYHCEPFYSKPKLQKISLRQKIRKYKKNNAQRKNLQRYSTGRMAELGEKMSHDLVIPLHDRMLVSNLEYVPIVIVPYPMHADGNITMTLENGKGEVLLEVNQRLNLKYTSRASKLVLSSPYQIGHKMNIYNSYYKQSRQNSLLETAEYNITEADVGINKFFSQQPWCHDFISGCLYELQTAMQEYILIRSNFLLNASEYGKEEYVANLTLKVKDAFVSVTPRKQKSVNFPQSFIEMQQQTPMVLLGFHQSSLSSVQRSGVSHMIRGMAIILATIALAASKIYLFSRDRHKHKADDDPSNTVDNPSAMLKLRLIQKEDARILRKRRKRRRERIEQRRREKMMGYSSSDE